MNTTSKLLFILGILCSTSLYADVTLEPNIECCHDIVYQINEQNKAITNHTKYTNENLKNLSLIKDNLHQIAQKKSGAEDFWGAFAGALTSAIVAISIFYGGIIHEKRKERTRRKLLLKSVSLLLESTLEKCNSTINNIEIFHTNVKKTPWMHNSFPQIIQGETQRLREINIDRIADAFFDFGISSKQYVEFYSKLDYFHELSRSMYDDYFKHSHEAVTVPTNEILELTEIILNAVVMHMEYLRNIEFGHWENINQIIIDYYKEQTDNKTNINYINTNLIIPLTNLYITFDQIQIPDIPNGLLVSLKRARSLYSFIVESNKHFSQEIFSKSESIDACKNTFNDIIITLKQNLKEV